MLLNFFLINAENTLAGPLMKMVDGKGTKQGLDVPDAEKAFKIVDEHQDQQMVPGVALFLRGGKKTVLGVVVDHGFGEDLVLLVSSGRRQPAVHESGNLVHVKLQIRKTLGLDGPDPMDALQYFIDQIFFFFHSCGRSLYSLRICHNSIII